MTPRRQETPPDEPGRDWIEAWRDPDFRASLAVSASAGVWWADPLLGVRRETCGHLFPIPSVPDEPGTELTERTPR